MRLAGGGPPPPAADGNGYGWDDTFHFGFTMMYTRCFVLPYAKVDSRAGCRPSNVFLPPSDIIHRPGMCLNGHNSYHFSQL